MASSGLTKRCHGSGIRICRCGGDICCCINDGYVDCPGCEDCESVDDWLEFKRRAALERAAGSEESGVVE